MSASYTSSKIVNFPRLPHHRSGGVYHGVEKQGLEARFSRTLLAARDVMDLMGRIEYVVNELGFSDFTFVCPVSLCFDTQLLTSMPSTIIESYYDGSLCEQDPLMQYASANRRPIFMSELHKRLNNHSVDPFLSSCMDGIVDLHTSCGYMDQYHIPLESHYGATNGKGAISRTLFSLADYACKPSDFKKKIELCGFSLLALGEFIHFVLAKKYSHLFSGLGISNSEISERDIRSYKPFSGVMNNDSSASAFKKQSFNLPSEDVKKIENIVDAFYTKFCHSSIDPHV